MLHFAKNRRAALIRHSIVVCPYYVRVASLERIDAATNHELGDVVLDQSSMGSMQDEYPIALFSVLVLKALLVKQCYAEAVYVAPLAFWIEAVRNECLDKESRLQMLHIAFTFFAKFYEGIDAIDPSLDIHTNDRGAQGYSFYFIASKIAIQQALNTLAAYMVELIHNDRLNFSRMSTMSLEHVNGQIRNVCNGDDTFERVKTFIAKYNIAMNIVSEMHIDLHKKKRDFQGGVTMAPEFHDFSLLLPDIAPTELYVTTLLTQAGWHEESRHELIQIFEEYVDQLCEIAAPVKIPKHLENQIRGQRILARYMQKTE